MTIEPPSEDELLIAELDDMADSAPIPLPSDFLAKRIQRVVRAAKEKDGEQDEVMPDEGQTNFSVALPGIPTRQTSRIAVGLVALAGIAAGAAIYSQTAQNDNEKLVRMSKDVEPLPPEFVNPDAIAPTAEPSTLSGHPPGRSTAVAPRTSLPAGPFFCNFGWEGGSLFQRYGELRYCVDKGASLSRQHGAEVLMVAKKEGWARSAVFVNGNRVR